MEEFKKDWNTAFSPENFGTDDTSRESLQTYIRLLTIYLWRREGNEVGDEIL